MVKFNSLIIEGKHIIKLDKWKKWVCGKQRSTIYANSSDLFQCGENDGLRGTKSAGLGKLRHKNTKFVE